MPDKIIRQIDISETSTPDLHELAAKYIYSLENGNPIFHTWEDITTLIGAGIQLVPLDELPTADEDAYASYSGKIVLTPIQGQTDRAEYIITRSETTPYTYKWEQIGTTAADLATKVDKGTYTTGVPSTNATGEAGAASITTSSAGSQTASGTATITYDKATSIDDHTIAAHSHTVNKATANITYVNGVKASGGTAEVVTGVTADGTATVITDITTTTTNVAVSGIASVGLTTSTTTTTGDGSVKYVEAITGSAPAMNTATGYATVFITTITGFNGGSKAADTFTPNTPTTLDLTKFNGGSFVQGAKASFTQGAKASLNYATVNAMQSATVTNGVLKWTKATVSNITNWAANGTDTFTPNGDDTFTAAKLNTGFYSVGSAASFSEGAFTSASLGTVTTKQVGVTGGSYTATIKYVKPTTEAASTTPVVKGVSASGTVSALTGVKASGTATVILNTGLSTTVATFMTGATLSENGATTLSHSINYTSVTVTGTAAVAVSNHTHNVDIPNHTHTLGNHTHNIDLQTA